MKWVFLVLELLMLFFTFNTLFMVPEQYDLFTTVAASTGIFLAALAAWLSSKRFAKSTSGEQPTWKNVATAPPAIIWIFVILVFCLVGFMKLVGYL